MAPIREQMELRLLQFRARLMQSNSTIIANLLALNKRYSLPWEKRCIETLNRYDITDVAFHDTHAWIKQASHNIRTHTQKSRMASLSKKVTTSLYRQLLTDTTQKPLYLTIPTSHNFVRMVYRLRAGDGYTMLNRHTRHLAAFPYCPYCPGEVEDESHLLISCPAYCDIRLTTIARLKLLPFPQTHNFNLYLLTLGSQHLESALKKQLSPSNLTSLFRTIEDYALTIDSIRSRALAGVNF